VHWAAYSVFWAYIKGNKKKRAWEAFCSLFPPFSFPIKLLIENEKREREEKRNGSGLTYYYYQAKKEKKGFLFPWYRDFFKGMFVGNSIFYFILLEIIIAG
jgi:hypothetical protein